MHLSGDVYIWTMMMKQHNISVIIHFPEERFSFVVLLCLILLGSITLNGLSVITYARNHLLHTPNNCLVVNMAVADIIQVSLSISSSFVSLVKLDWAADPWICRLLGSILHLSFAASVNTCVVICFHRFVSIVYSHKKILSTVSSCWKVLLIIWFYSLAMVLMGVFRPYAYQFNPVLGSCSMMAILETDSVFAAYTFILHFILPFCIMLGLYMKIYKTVVIQRVSLVTKEMSNAIDVVTQKTKKLMIAALSVFILTWLPFYVMLQVSVYYPRAVPYPTMIVVWVLQLLGTILNPILYAVCNRLYIRCMIRLIKCKGPLYHKRLSSIPKEISKLPTTAIHSSSQFEAELGGMSMSGGVGGHVGEHSVAQLSDIEEEDAEEEEEEELGQLGKGSLSSGDTQMTGASEVENTLGELPSQFGYKHSLCSHMSDMSGYSSRSSVPTVMRMPIQRINRTYSTASQQSYIACGPTPTDSGRCSYATTPGPDSNRTSFSSQYYPQSARASVMSQYNMYFLSPSSTRSNTPSLPGCPSTPKISSRMSSSFGSRQSMYGLAGSRSARSSMSYSRSARSSMSYSRSARSSMSSRLSHYMPFPVSARSSIISEYTVYDPASACSTRAGSPTAGGDLLLNSHTDVEFIHPMEEDEEERSNSKSTSSTGHSTGHTPDPSRSPEYDPRQRLSAVMLGDIEPEEAYDMIVEEIEERRKYHGKGKWRDTFRKSHINPKVRKAVSILNKLSGGKLNLDPSHQELEVPEQTSPPKITPKTSPKERKKSEKKIGIIEEENSSELAAEEADFGCNKKTSLTSMGKAVSVVVKARRLRSRVRSIIVPVESIISIQEPTIKIREHSPSPMPLETPPPKVFKRGGNYALEKRPMSHLRVPGRHPPINVPQTIFEEDIPAEILPPETPTRRRKNASTWIAPPVIDVQDDCDVKEMRVASPGVLVEQHM